jgi:hypothetical protein
VQLLQIPGAVEDSVEGRASEAHRQEAPVADGAAGVAGVEQQVPVTDVREGEGEAHHKADEGDVAGQEKEDSEGLDSSGSGIAPIAAEISHKFISTMTVNANRRGSLASIGSQGSGGKGSPNNAGVFSAARAQIPGMSAFSQSVQFMLKKDDDSSQLRKSNSEKRDSLKVT